MKSLTVIHSLIIAALGLAACTAAPAATSTPAPATEAPATEAPATEVPATEPPAEQPTEAATEAASTGLSGVRVYSFDSAASSASYSVDETFLTDNRLATAVGQTSTISGQLEINFDDPAASNLGTIEVDISTLESDSPRRDNAIRSQWLESSTFPLATYTVTAIDGLAAAPAEGEQVAFSLTGDMTVRETSLPVTWEVVATVSGESISGTATTNILMADFGIEPPNIGGILSVTDGVVLTLEFVLTPVE